MKKQINLIPAEMAVSPKTVKLQKIITKLFISLTIILLLSIVTLAFFLIYYNSNLRTTLSENEVLKSRILTLEASEQKLVLAKDKLSKVKSIMSNDTIDKEFDNFKKFQNILLETNVSSSSAYSESVIAPDKTEISIAIPDINSLSNLLGSISRLSDYNKIFLSSLGFNLKTGYLLSLVFED